MLERVLSLFRPAPPRAPAPDVAPLLAPLKGPPPPRRDRFEACLPIVLLHEGGYVDDPADPGGATNYGISLRAARGFGSLADVDGDGDVDADDILLLTPAQAGAIYKAHYWAPLRCEALPAGVDLVVFDIGVNAGPRAAVLMLQRALTVKVDRVLGPQTLAAAALAEARTVIDRMAALRAEHYRALPGYPRFGRGWLRRTEAVRQAAQDMAARAPLWGQA